MRDDLINYFTTDNISGKKCTEKWLSKNNIDLYNQIIDWCNLNSLEFLEFKRKVFHYITNCNKIPVCLNCNKEVKYRRLRDGYQPYCSSLCQNSCSISKENWLKSWKKGNSNNEHIDKRNITILEKYGDLESYAIYTNNKKVESCLKKHGVEYVTQTDFYKERRKKTLNEKYGSENYNNPNKTKETRIHNGTQINDDCIKDFLSYKKIATNRTMTMYRNNIQFINPNSLKRGIKLYHVDHKFSLKQGYLIGLPIEVITHPVNLEMIHHKDNLIKQDNCSISIQDLLNNIIKFEDNLYFTNNELMWKYKSVKDVSEKLLKEINQTIK
jgi:hypothetical protein